MCTAITYKTKDNYFGRNLDLEYGYNETVTVTPRNYKFLFSNKMEIKQHFAIIGIATVVSNYPLYYDAANEYGLAMAGLNFPDNAYYFSFKEGKQNIAPFEFIPWILSQCKNLNAAKSALSKINLCNINFNNDLPVSPLHWIITDKSGSITVESVKEGLKIYENPVGILTNNPSFDFHMTNLCNYMNLSPMPVENKFENINLTPYSKGMGAIGLPGDVSSASRFIRAAFIKLNSISDCGENESVSQFFHILNSVAQIRGTVRLPESKYEITRYSSCINTNKGIYYYTTYDNCSISAVNMHNCDLNSDKLINFLLANKLVINYQN